MNSYTGWTTTPVCSDGYYYATKYLDGSNEILEFPDIITKIEGNNNQLDMTTESTLRADAGKIHKLKSYPMTNNYVPANAVEAQIRIWYLGQPTQTDFYFILVDTASQTATLTYDPVTPIVSPLTLTLKLVGGGAAPAWATGVQTGN